MLTALGDLKALLISSALDSIDDPILLSDAPRPPALEIAFQRLRLSRTPER
jgi:hypothetical protein